MLLFYQAALAEARVQKELSVHVELAFC